jgi:DNA-binding MarR family transcriptional regulator
MPKDQDILRIAEGLRVGLSLLLRRLRQVPLGDGELTLPQTAALVRLDRGGPATSSELAKQEQISPQSMGATLAALEAYGLVERTPDPADGRRILMSLSAAGREALRDRRAARSEVLAKGLASGFTDEELELLKAVGPLFERLAERI